MSFRLELSDCAEALPAQLVGDSVAIHGVSIDTRTLKPGDLYVAIVGERFDGHDFVDDALQAGAAAVMVQRRSDISLPQLEVSNTQSALGELGKYWAARFSIPIIAVTGSNGKTTVKEIIASILGQLGPVLSTKGNLNNELGVPLTLLDIRDEHLYAVIEMGANHAGEIARLVALAKPDVALVTNIGTAHLEGFGSVEGIAAAKSEIYAGLKPSGYGVINADDKFAPFMRTACEHCHRREFGLSLDADVSALPGDELVIASMGEKMSPRFQLVGEHNYMNALAAVAAVQCFDVDTSSIVSGLEAVTAVPGRLEKKAGAAGTTIIDDTYNANPESTRSAINVLKDYQGRRFLILGDMKELGDDARQLHRAIGEFARCQGIDGLWTVGELSREAHEAFHDAGSEHAVATGAHFNDQQALIDDLHGHLDNDVTILVKGSRSSRMETVVGALLDTSMQVHDRLARPQA